MFSFSRTLFSFNNMFVDKYKIVDSEYDHLVKTITDSSEEFKKIVSTVELLPKNIDSFTSQHLQIFKSLQFVSTLSSKKNDENDEEVKLSKETFDKIQKVCEQYSSSISQLVTPLRTYTEQFNEMRNRLKVCEKRKEDYEYWTKKLNEMNKKSNSSSNKKNFEDVQKDFIQSKENYEWLKEELIEDMNKLIIDSQGVVLPFIRILFTSFTELFNGISENWKQMPEHIEKLPNCGIKLEYVIRFPQDSLIKEENCMKKKQDIIQMQYQQVPPPQIVEIVHPNVNNEVIYSVPPKIYPYNENEQIPITNLATNNVPQYMSPPIMQTPVDQVGIHQNQIPQQNENETISSNQNQQPQVVYLPKNTPLPPIPKKKLTCIVNYDYDAENSHELTMKQGDIITIISKEGDWWIGELNGKTGQFPSNYVSIQE